MTDYSDVWVCTDCYFAHHYGITAMVRDESGNLWGPFSSDDRADMVGTEFVWFAGDSDTPCEREPLNRLDGYELSDNTCADHYYGQDPQSTDEFEVYDVACDHCGHNGPENGIQEFSWSQCGGCGSMLGGSRYRLACTPISATARE